MSFLRTCRPLRHAVSLFAMIVVAPLLAPAQDVEALYRSLRSSRELHINGGLSISNNSYFSRGIAARQDALQWLINANLNLRFLGIDAPFALSFSDGNRTFRLPSYTFAGISPTYKWGTLHLGDRVMTFSPYTLNGLMFRGAGFELKPGRWYAGAMYGRLSRAAAEDLTARQRLDPLYLRRGYGARVGYAGTSTSVSLSYFGAADDEGSIPTPELSTVLPQQNAVLSLQAAQQFTRKVSVQGELAQSATNLNTFADDLAGDDRTLQRQLFGLFRPNEAVRTGTAGRIQAVYNLRSASVNAGYERIDAGFRTLGALFFLSDVERITAGGTKTFLANRLFATVNVGTERTDLEDASFNAARRFIGSANVTYSPTNRLSFNGNYSNFQNAAKLRAVSDPAQLVDSLILAQVTESIGGGVSLQTGNAERPNLWTLNVTRQSANSVLNDEVVDDARSRFLLASLFFSRSGPQDTWNWSAGLSWNNTRLVSTTSNMLSPTVSVSRVFNKKIDARSSLSYNEIFTRGAGASRALTLNLSGLYRLRGGHGLGLDANFINRIGGGPDFTEFYNRLFYRYNFAQSVGRK